MSDLSMFIPIQYAFIARRCATVDCLLVHDVNDDKKINYTSCRRINCCTKGESFLYSTHAASMYIVSFITTYLRNVFDMTIGSCSAIKRCTQSFISDRIKTC